MSCDYAVWHTKKRLTNAEAGRLYEALCEGDTSGVSPDPAVDAFYAELTALHPELDDLPDSDLDRSPWSSTIDRSPGHLVMTCVWSKADYAGKLLIRLAKKHGLALFDPQSEEIIYPDDAPRSVARRFWDALKEEGRMQKDPWYVNVLIGLLFFLIAWFDYRDLNLLARGYGYGFARSLYKLGGPLAAVGVPAAIGSGFLFFGLRALAKGRRNKRAKGR